MHSWVVVGNVYQCSPRVVQIDQSRNVVGVSQNHLQGNTEQDVKALRFYNQEIDFFPKDIDLFFTNLEFIQFQNCPIKSFTKDDLKNFLKLRLFEVYIGQLTTISGDVFKYSPELEFAGFSGNRITNVGPGIFQHSTKIAYARFTNNLCINSRADNNTEEVATVALELAFKCPPSVEMVEEIILTGEDFREAVADRVEQEIIVTNDRVQQLQEDYEALHNNHTAVLKQMQQLKEDNILLSNNLAAVTQQSLHLEEKVKQANEKFETLVFNLCAIYAICQT